MLRELNHIKLVATLSLGINLPSTLEDVQESLEDVSPLKEDLRRKVMHILVLKLLATLKHSLWVTKLQSNRQIEEFFLILL